MLCCTQVSKLQEELNHVRRQKERVTAEKESVTLNVQQKVRRRKRVISGTEKAQLR